jgi:hypothetical protein
VLQSSLVSRDTFRQGARPPSPSESGQGVAASGAFYPRKNGFVNTVLDAYNKHHALVLRPDDIWLCILTQFSLFVNGPGRAEALRSKFVAHEGKKEIEVTATGSRYTVDFGSLAQQMTDQIQKNVVDPALRNWIIPNFTTTTNNDLVAASVIMMATLKAYFDYKMSLLCGIPRVTLLGDKSDWEDILTRVEKLKEYGPETKAWYSMLQPVIRRFVRSFEPGVADSKANLDFWQRVAHYSGGGSGPTYLSGWITAFCVFEDEGKWNGDDLGSYDAEPAEAPIEYNEPEGDFQKPKNVLVLDGVSYPSIDSNDIPMAVSEVPVKLNDNGEELETTMLAGLVGTAVGDSGVTDGRSTGKQDQLNPVVGWWMFTLKKDVVQETTVTSY